MRGRMKCREHLSWIRRHLFLFSLTGKGTNNGERPERPAEWCGLSGKAFRETREWLENFGKNRQKVPVSHRPIDPK